MIFTRPQQHEYLIQMPPKSNRRTSSLGTNVGSIGSYSMFRSVTQSEPISNNIVSEQKRFYQSPEKLKEILSTKEEQPKQVKAMKWGEPTWFLFHTLAEKVKEEHFSNFRGELLKTIYLICSALPCPDCAKHASDYMNGINFNAIRTKEDLKLMLYTFHNTVNKRKNFPIFPREELDAKYSVMNTVKIIQNFMINYSPLRNKTYSLDVNKHYRQVVSNQLVGWFNENMNKFDQ